ncbi:MAG: SCP2 sterol-binding domain-containing protein [Acidimicrobiaceae bacterium]|nr:SCP2 sterol-binding domain-containing protein [Acidimicrobiia bacterium]MCY4494376.1 SCP2 sterol-binding domain-containing protein [Acidimicrobiaceae bacterium]
MQVFDQEWTEAAAAAVAGLPPVAGLDAVVEYTVSGRPGGRVALTVTVSDGTVSEIALGRSPDPDVTVTLGYADAVAILSGELSSEAGYMNGAVKVEGDYRRWLLDLRPVRLAAIEALAPLMARTRRQ